ncbi:MAG: DNA gyrase inhibitor YacG [Pseudomonadota bacterium]|jgi:uncharacterized protein|uniref:DNA gyrase inhibitor YacG n=1 Tax=Methylophaga TaxID=40222 RepID=UPI00059113F2|nr:MULTISPECIES: DNA gyrase inhibitor YacG [Methylophaga]MEC9413660.1 DNA gyrase inhibitor YacG [Pseudomonadota bacterium]HIC45682.1 DNA gyrase inhibitor YacG [Methylophaga sp.]HIM40146.1 DNA gyrase inhibitor YacG [Methylophaga aminisulfidivorans]
MVTTVNCPQCGTLVPWQKDQVWKPFCSERCKLIDLGEWASEGHRIPGPPVHSPLDDNDESDYH